MGQSWFHLHLINLFRNEYIKYIIYIDARVHNMRNRLLYDIFIWNMNSFLVKKSLPCSIEENSYMNYSVDEENRINEFVVLSMLSPTKIYIYFHTFDPSEISKMVPPKNTILCNSPRPELKYSKQINIPSFNHLLNDEKYNLPHDNIVLNTILYMINCINHRF